MEWALEYAEHIEFLEDVERIGGDVTALDTRPMLGPDLEYVMQHYLLLTRSRPPSMGSIAKIPMTEIEAVYRMFEMKEAMPAGDFIGYVQFLDDVFCEWYRKHQKRR